MRTHDRRIIDTVTEQLLSAGLLAQPESVTSLLVERVRATVDGGVPAADIDAHDRALACLAATARLERVFRRSDRKEHEQRLGEMAALSGPAVPALRKALRAARAMMPGGS